MNIFKFSRLLDKMNFVLNLSRMIIEPNPTTGLSIHLKLMNKAIPDDKKFGTVLTEGICNNNKKKMHFTQSINREYVYSVAVYHDR